MGKLRFCGYAARVATIGGWRTFRDGVFGAAFNPFRALRFWQGVLEYYDLCADDPVLGSKDAVDILPVGYQGDVIIQGSYYGRRASDTRIMTELVTLAYVMQSLRPRRVFEIGTFIGRTTRLFALNSPPTTEILTLDLPESRSEARLGVGVDYRQHPEAARKITQLVGDSTQFDYTPYLGTCDFVWVDGNHDYSFAVSDTKNALALCKPGGWIGWHDYRHSAAFSGVTRCVRSLQSEHRDLHHVRGTTIVLLKRK